MRKAYARYRVAYSVKIAVAIMMFAFAAYMLSAHHLNQELILSERNLRYGITYFVFGCLILYNVVLRLVIGSEPAGSSTRQKLMKLAKRWFYLTMWLILLGMLIADLSIQGPRQLWYDINNLFG